MNLATNCKVRELLGKLLDHWANAAFCGSRKTLFVICCVFRTELIVPAVYCGWFKMFEASPRSSIAFDSEILNLFASETSKLLMPGICSVLRPAFDSAPTWARMYRAPGFLAR